MSEKPEALRLADELDVASLGIRGCLESLSAAELRRLHADNERLREALPYDWDQLEACRGSLREHMAEIKRLTADNERLKGLLREAREYLPEHHPIAESLFPRIDQALQEPPR